MKMKTSISLSSIENIDGLFTVTDIARRRPNSARLRRQRLKPDIHILETLKPLGVALRVFGMFPIQKAQHGAWFYSFCFYIMYGMYSLAVIRLRYNNLMDRVDMDFVDTIFHYMCILYASMQLCFPVINWAEGKKITAYLNNWSKLQVHLIEVTAGTPTMRWSRTVLLIWVVLLPVTIILNVLIQQYLLNALASWEGIYYFYPTTMVLYQAALWYVLAELLADTSVHLADSLEMRIQGLRNTPIAQYKLIWRELSQLTEETGNAMYFSYGYIILMWFTTLVLQIYGALPNDVVNITSPFQIGLGLNAVLIMSTLFIIYNAADYATNMVGKDFLVRLNELEVLDGITRYEIYRLRMFVHGNKPTISLGGFVTINRSVFVSLLSAVVTYSVVLAQFKQSTASARFVNTTLALPQN